MRWEYKKVEGTTENDQNNNYDIITEEQLNELGKAGWEMVSGSWYTHNGDGYLTGAVFKRPLSD